MDFSIGDLVSLKDPVSYLKTADPMPMMRPPDLVSSEEVGEVMGFSPIDNFQVKFRRGTFLLPGEKLKKVLLEKYS